MSKESTLEHLAITKREIDSAYQADIGGIELSIKFHQRRKELRTERYDVDCRALEADIKATQEL